MRERKTRTQDVHGGSCCVWYRRIDQRGCMSQAVSLERPQRIARFTARPARFGTFARSGNFAEASPSSPLGLPGCSQDLPELGIVDQAVARIGALLDLCQRAVDLLVAGFQA
jgi:hypothetical protein